MADSSFFAPSPTPSKARRRAAALHWTVDADAADNVDGTRVYLERRRSNVYAAGRWQWYAPCKISTIDRKPFRFTKPPQPRGRRPLPRRDVTAQAPSAQRQLSFEGERITQGT